MEDGEGKVERCVFCNERVAEPARVPTVFGAAAVCRSCWPRYRQHVQRAIDLFGVQQRTAVAADQAA
ncbi:MAG: hypothetical protein KDA57_05405 [Planctomycetales bacterium]|nr:hypothetical protein [Planctomycetales bacterium]